MIVKTKNKQFASCLCCGGCNMQPKINTGLRFAECGDVYSYLISNIVEIRLCNECARELKRELEKQINGEEDVYDE